MSSYAKNWDNYYDRIYKKLRQESLWAVDAAQAVEQDHRCFAPYLRSDLPCLDIGCGTGEQTVKLRSYFSEVIGLEVANTALKIARERHFQDGLDFRYFDLSKPNTATVLHQELGDCNLYIRGVLHQITTEDRELMRQSLASLIGSTGKIYINEVGSGIRDYLQGLGTGFSNLPARMRLALMANLPPLGLSEESLLDWFPVNNFKILEKGATNLATNLILADGRILAIPSVYAIIANQS